jgi:hypothetical protein
MHRGRIVDGTVKAVVNHTDGPRLRSRFRERRDGVDSFSADRYIRCLRPVLP